MPFYEYECQKGHRFEMRRDIDQRNDTIHCDICRGIARLVVSRPAAWQRGWGFLKALSEKSESAPNDAGYYPKWDS